MKYEQQIFNPPQKSQAYILHEDRISELQVKIKHIYTFAAQLKAHQLYKQANKQIKEAKRQEEKLNALFASPEALAIPLEMFHG